MALVARVLLTTRDRRVGVGLRLVVVALVVWVLLTTQVRQVGVGLSLGLAVAVRPDLVAAVATRPSQVRRWVVAVALGLAACRRRRVAPRVGT